MTKRSRSGSRRAAFVCALTLVLGCTFVQRNTGKTLVEDDAPIFDTRFRDLDPDDIDLSDFWREGSAEAAGETIPIHHRTFADIVDRVGDGIVNLYTIVVQEREARLGIKPSDILPFRIPVVSALLMFLNFVVDPPPS